MNVLRVLCDLLKAHVLLVAPMLFVFGLTVVSCSHSGKHSSGALSSRIEVSDSFKLPSVEEVTLDNGLKLFLIYDDRLPYVSYSFFFNIGSIHDSSQDLGLTQLTMRLLDKGTRQRNARQISDRMAAIAAPVMASAASEFSGIGASTLARFQSELVTELNELVLNPSFPEAEVARQKEQLIAELKRMQDQPSQLASYLFEGFLYQGHPYSQPANGVISTVSKISRADLVKHFNQWFGPQNASVVVVGHYKQETIDMVKSQLGRWRSAQLNWKLDLPTWLPKARETKIEKRPSLTQAEVRIGTQGVARNHPDYLALRVANVIFGQSMGSRLMSRIRTELGLTYTIHSAWDPRRVAGSFLVEFSTRAEKVNEAIAEVQRLVKKFGEQGLTASELEVAKAQAMGSFPLVVETPEKYVSQLLLLRLNGVEDSYLQNFMKNVQALTLTQVNAALARHVSVESLRTVIVTKQ